MYITKLVYIGAKNAFRKILGSVGRPDPKIFLKALLAPIYTNFEGERAPKKNAIFFVKIFQKVPKNGFFLTVFSKICLRRRKICQNRGKTVLWESSKNQFGRPKKKKVVKILENFLKFRPPPPPRENPRSAPVHYNTYSPS